MDKSVFSKFIARMKREGILKSLLYGIINGFAVNFLVMAVFYLLNVFLAIDNLLSIGLWLSIGVGALVGVVTGFVVYFTRYKPTVKRVAERVDSLGLEERLITMLEFEKDESYIAMRQREDAKTHLGKVDSKSIKFNFAKSVIVAAAVCAVLGLSMTTVGALTTFNVIEPIDPGEEFRPSQFAAVIYEVEGEGEIYYYDENVADDESKIREAREDEDPPDAQIIDITDPNTKHFAKPVVAIAEEGYAFAGWLYEDLSEDEDHTSPIRNDDEITGRFVRIALFQEAEDSEGGGDPGEGNGEPGDDEGDDPTPPPDENAPPKDGEGGENEEGSGKDNSESENPSQSDPSDDEQQPDDDSDQASGNDRYADANKYKDGDTPYTDEYSIYSEQVLQEMLDDPNLSAEDRAAVEAYLKSLGIGVSDSTEGEESGEGEE